jgi:hypothetical protein
MVCLFCGKELPFFRKLTSHGEFCSAEHRRRFQEDYDKRALVRLRDARPPVAAPESEAASAAAPAAAALETFEPLPLLFENTLSADWLSVYWQRQNA